MKLKFKQQAFQSHAVNAVADCFLKQPPSTGVALAYEGDPENLSAKLRTEKDINEIFRKAQATFNAWTTLPPEDRTPAAILNALDFDFFELLDSVTIARSRKHITTFYDTKDIGPFPTRLKPLSFHCPLTHRRDVIGVNDIFNQLVEAVVDRRGREHQHLGLDALLDDGIHQLLVARLVVLEGVVVAEVVRLINHDEVVVGGATNKTDDGAGA